MLICLDLKHMIHNSTKLPLISALLLFSAIALSLNACASAPAYYENVKGVFPAVVRVLTSDKAGSGVIVTKTGYVLTSQHVVDNNTTVTVQLNNGTSYLGNVAAADEATDLAVIKLPDAQAGYTYATTGNSNESDALQISSPVLVVGYPGGNDINNLSLTTGTICAFPKMQSVSYIQSDAKVYAGSSGGPMVDSAGNVIGIINSRYTNMEGHCATFATAINEARTLLSRVEQGQTAATQPVSPVTQPSTAQTSCSEVGCHAPDFSLLTPDGKTITLDSLKGKKAILAFVSTRCATCLQITLCIQQFYDNWPREQMEVVFIVSQEKAPDVASWIKTYGFKNPVVLDTAGDVYNLYRPDKEPALYFLDGDGTIKIKKYAPIDDCATELDSLLRLY